MRFEGFQPPGRVALYLAAGDLGVVPNRSEPAISSRYTSPLKVFEMMACGLPMLVSDLPSLREILTSDEAFFVEPDSVESLAEGLKKALESEKLRRSMQERLISRASHFGWDARARRIRQWMQERLAAGGGS